MPMSNESLNKDKVPLKEEVKAKAEAKVSAAELLDGAASGRPEVHQLMANRYIASMNGDEQAYVDYTVQLAELGYK